MRILIVTDAWTPQVNGVVRTLSSTIQELERMGHEVKVIEPGGFPSIPCPTYPEIRLALASPRQVHRMITMIRPDAVHVATEGPLGIAARIGCARAGIPFTTSFATRFPDYIHARFRIPPTFTFKLLRWFHSPSQAVMVATEALRLELEGQGMRNVVLWGRGVDTELFRPRTKAFLDAPRPILLYVGRVAVEKNITAFLDLPLKGTKYVVGDGPQLHKLKRSYPDVRFVGARHGEELARYYAAADVLVMPSLTETFGLVMLEALASGVPVAAYPAQGPKAVLGDSGAGCLDNDLARAVEQAITIPPERCREHAKRYSWEAVTRRFIANLAPVGPRQAASAIF
ncbi:MAG: glycosyltransferase family 1 protein [Deltaproteobacteria bacterium]